MKRTIALTTAAVVGLFLLLVPQAATAGVSTVGYFTRNPAASAPAGGLQVANAPDGIISLGAVKVAETPPFTSATISIPEVTVTKPPATALGDPGAFGLRACPASGEFKAGKGTIAEAPKSDCNAGSVTLTRQGTGEWTGDVTSLLTVTTPAVVIVPTPGSGTFQADFAKPSLEVVAESGGDGTSGLESDFDASEFGGSGGSGDSSGSSDFSGSSGDSSGSSGSGEFAGSSSSSSSFEPSSSSGSSFGGSFTTVPTQAAAVAAEVVPEVQAPPVLESGESSLPTRRRLTGQTTSSSRGSTSQFVFYVLAAAAIGTAAGFGRNRLISARSS